MELTQLTVEEIALRWPAAAPVLEQHGFASTDVAQTLAAAAAAQGVAEADVAADLAKAGVDAAALAAAEANPIVDVRAMPPRERHPRIFATFDVLSVGSALTLVNDHDPKPLFYQMQAERPGQIDWAPREEGPERWVIDIKRVA